MNPISWWRGLRENPVYLRERGGWGKPNPFYDRLSRLSPFVVIGALFFGICAASSNPALFAGGDAYAVFYCFLCLPAMLLSALTMFGTLMAPALTAPSVSMEMNRGTWEVLRMTPQSTRSILLAKLFGALARLRIWPLLLALSLLQGVLMTCSVTLAGAQFGLGAAALGLATVIRPWLEVFFAAFAGIYLSTRIRSEIVALAATYGTVIGLKMFNSTAVWMATFGLLEQDDKILLAGGLGPVATYLIAIAGLWFGFSHQASRLSYG